MSEKNDLKRQLGIIQSRAEQMDADLKSINETLKLPEYRQKQVIFKSFCNQCQRKDKCLCRAICDGLG